MGPCLGKACLARGGDPQDFDINISNSGALDVESVLYVVL
jgi:hypothetical protein